MSAVVATSEEDPALAVIRFTAELSWADAGPEVKKIFTYWGGFAHLFFDNYGMLSGSNLVTGWISALSYRSE